MRSYKLWSVFSKATAFSSLLFAIHAFAVVNIDRTRIIFNANENSQTINVKNSPENPTIVQIWSDEGDLMQLPDQSKAPIFAIPPIIKLSPNEQRAIRLMLTSRDALPEDKESLYWLNIYQIPALTTQAGSAERKIVLPLRLRLKVFIRPAQLAAPTPEDVQRLYFEVHNNTLTVINPTPWFMSLRLQILNNIRVNDIFIAPDASQMLPLNQPVKPNEKVYFEVFDDNGNAVSYAGITRAPQSGNQ